MVTCNAWKALDLDDLTEIFGSTYTIIVAYSVYLLYWSQDPETQHFQLKAWTLYYNLWIMFSKKQGVYYVAFSFPKELLSIMGFCLNQDRMCMNLKTDKNTSVRDALESRFLK